MRFFFYGTLIQGSCNSVASHLHPMLKPHGPAQVAGDLFAIPDPAGWYPALVAGQGTVHGMVYAQRDHFSADNLARMDAYEDYDPGDPDRSLYVRSDVMLADGSTAHAYVWNRDLPDGARPIAHGNFRRWLAEQGVEQFRGPRDS